MAKPLHIGHLRSAIIGESVKRIYRYFGNHVIGDIHLGDWGLQMGLIIEEVRDRHPELPTSTRTSPVNIRRKRRSRSRSLKRSIPRPVRRARQDEAFAARAHHATYLLQSGDRGYRAMWEHIMRVSVADLKRNYENLNVSFDVWLGESDAQKYIPQMLDIVKGQGPDR